MRGKYSPTVTAAYMRDQRWFDKIVGDNYLDPEGYDQYGYDQNNRDRAGNDEYEYWPDNEDGINYKYEDVLSRSSFDGTKPVVKE